MRIERDYPITVYDVEDKKAVMVFETAALCQKYVWDKPIGRGGNIYDLLEMKGKSKKNRFYRTICFRRANENQIETLGDNKMVILDERFDIKGVCKIESGYHTTRTDLYNNHCRLPNGKSPIMLGN